MCIFIAGNVYYSAERKEFGYPFVTSREGYPRPLSVWSINEDRFDSVYSESGSLYMYVFAGTKYYKINSFNRQVSPE